MRWPPSSRREKIKATIEGFGCTGGKIEKADFGYEVDDVKCKDGQEYEIKLDPNFKLIVMTKGWPGKPTALPKRPREWPRCKFNLDDFQSRRLLVQELA